MNYHYCGSCGSKIEYSLKRPNFCPSCGANVGQAASSPSLANSNPAIANITESVDTEGTNINSVPHLEGIQYEIDGDSGGVIWRSHGTLGDLLSLNPASSPPALPAGNKKPPSKASAKKTAPSKPGTMEKFAAVKQSVEECKSSADRVVDVGDD